MGSYFVITYMYSLMTHINSGMSGIARYLAWANVIMLFTVALYYGKIITKEILRKIASSFIALSLILTGSIIHTYNPYRASNNVSSVHMQKFPAFVLEYAPSLYNPLFSTFNSRANNIDGGYQIASPVVYSDKDGYVRKILTSSNDYDTLYNNFVIENGDSEWFYQQIENLDENLTYINIPHKYKIIYYPLR